jgi:hypothetical protein
MVTTAEKSATCAGAIFSGCNFLAITSFRSFYHFGAAALSEKSTTYVDKMRLVLQHDSS